MAEHTSAPARLVAGLSPLDQLEACLRLLCTGPAPLALDGRRIGHGLPRRPIRCDELAAVLAHPSCGHEAKRKVWARLVARARNGDSGWVVACCGVALPGLRRAAARLAYAASRADVEADLLAGFLTALVTVDTRASGVCGRLVNAALIHARGRLREQQAAAAGESRSVPGSAVPRPPVGHPDLVLARAVQLEVITAFEAELIGDTRLEDTTVADWADRNQLSRKACYERRRSAEVRLVAAIGAGTLSDPTAEVVAEATTTVAADPITDAADHLRPGG